MAPEKAPAFQMYPKDILTDENFGMMSYTERGIYLTLLFRCWLEQSLPPNLSELARLLKLPRSRFERLWNGPLSRCFYERDGRLYNKRLDVERLKQEMFRRRQSDNGRLGGRPPKPTGKPDETHGLANPKPKKALLSSISDLRTEERETSSLPPPAEAFRDLWNAETFSPIPRCRDLTATRKRHLKARLAEAPLDDWRDVCRRIQASAFCRGQNDRGWVASFDWLVGSSDVRVKVLEGKYDDRRQNGTQPRPMPRQDEGPKLVLISDICEHDPMCGSFTEHERRVPRQIEGEAV